MENRLSFCVTGLSARVDEGVPIQWQGKQFDSGPLTIELDESVSGASCGVLDYSQQHATAEFHVVFRFPEFANLLESMSVAKEFTEPVRAILRSEGSILDDHSFQFSGPAEVHSHALLENKDAKAAILPGT